MSCICNLFVLLTVRSAKNRPEYFADKLHDSIKGLGTDDSRLIRIIVSRCEVIITTLYQVIYCSLVT